MDKLSKEKITIYKLSDGVLTPMTYWINCKIISNFFKYYCGTSIEEHYIPIKIGVLKDLHEYLEWIFEDETIRHEDEAYHELPPIISTIRLMDEDLRDIMLNPDVYSSPLDYMENTLEIYGSAFNDFRKESISELEKLIQSIGKKDRILLKYSIIYQ